MKKQRNSSLELLRIICMILIIIAHYSVHGGYDTFTVENLTGNEFFIQILSIFGQTSCFIFSFISGYYLIMSKKRNQVNLSLIAEFFFYSWVIYILAVLFKAEPLSLKSAVAAAFPIFWGNWYIRYYIMFSLFIPFLNPFLRQLSKKTFIKLIIIVFVIWSIILTFVPGFLHGLFSFSYFDFFLFTYSMGAYIRLYENDCTYPNKWNLYAALISGAGIVLSVAVLDYLGLITGDDRFISNALYFANNSSPLVIICAVGMLMYFKNVSFYNFAVNRIAASTLGILLIHDGYWYNEKIIWEMIFPNINYLGSPWLPVHVILKCSAVFICCLIIDQIRLLTVDRLFQKWLAKQHPFLKNKYERIKSKFISLYKLLGEKYNI